MHQHGAMVLLIGLSGRLAIELEDGVTFDCHSALIDAGVRHRLDPQGERIASIYTEVDAPETHLLRSLYLQTNAIAVDLVKPSMRSFATQNAIFDFDLERILGIKQSSYQLEHFDPRINQCLALMNNAAYFDAKQAELAEHVCLSASRLNHVFKQSTGLAYQRYKLWSQLSYFMRDVQTTNSITASAHNSGFCDAAHLTNSYRKALGISPASLLKGLARFEVIVD